MVRMVSTAGVSKPLSLLRRAVAANKITLNSSLVLYIGMLGSFTASVALSELRRHERERAKRRQAILNNRKTTANKLSLSLQQQQKQLHSKFPLLSQLLHKLRMQWQKLMDSLRLLWRVVVLSSLFGPVACTRAFAMQAQDNEWRDWWWSYLRQQLLRSGPTFSKLAQWVATHNDLLPDEGRKHLSDLYSTSHVALSEAELIEMLDRDFSDWREYLTIDTHQSDPNNNTLQQQLEQQKQLIPIGCGCVAQVVRGTWKKDGQSVAIKLIRQHMRQTVTDDVTIIRWAAKTFSKEFNKQYKSIDSSLDEFLSMMLKQLNLFDESDNLLRFRMNFNCDELEHKFHQKKNRNFSTEPFVSFPYPLFPLVSQTILVETLSEGKPLSSLLGSEDKTDESIKQEIALLGLHAVLKMIFEDNFIHVDLHPENIIVNYDQQNQSSSASSCCRNLQVSFIDAGIVTALNMGDFANLLNVSIAVLFNDPDKFSRLIVEGSPDKYCASITGFRKAVEKILDKLHSEKDISKVDFVELANVFLQACAKFEVKLEQRLVYLVLGLTMLQGIGQRLHPDINLMKAIMPYIVDAGQRYLTHHERWYATLFSSEKSFDRLT